MELFKNITLDTEERDGTLFVRDGIRRQFLVMTPEEEVRQKLIRWLVEAKGFPGSLMSVEKGVRYHAMEKRYDLLIYDRKGSPLVCIECKSPKVKIDRKVFDQAALYNDRIGAPYIMLCNGNQLFLLSRGLHRKYDFVKELPDYEALLQG